MLAWATTALKETLSIHLTLLWVGTPETCQGTACSESKHTRAQALGCSLSFERPWRHPFGSPSPGVFICDEPAMFVVRIKGDESAGSV